MRNYIQIIEALIREGGKDSGSFTYQSDQYSSDLTGGTETDGDTVLASLAQLLNDRGIPTRQVPMDQTPLIRHGGPTQHVYFFDHPKGWPYHFAMYGDFVADPKTNEYIPAIVLVAKHETIRSWAASTAVEDSDDFETGATVTYRTIWVLSTFRMSELAAKVVDATNEYRF